jgi:hypothetical protein
VPRTLLCVAALAAFSLPCRAEQTITSTETLIRLTVQPMAGPKPAMRYQLLPELNELNPGNPIEGYLRCFPEQGSFFSYKEACERREKLQSIPLTEVLERELQFGPSALREADRAARLDKPDWQILLQLKTDGIGLLLPDLQQLRSVANGLKVRFRAEAAQHRFDDGLGTAKTLFAMARHLGEHPTLIGDLVGIAITYAAIGPLEEMLEQPGCPNLYWALTNLPNPLVSLEKGMAGERVNIAGEFRDLNDSVPMNPDQLKKLVAHIDYALERKNTHAWLDERIKDDGRVSAARRRLVEGGLPEERLLRFPPEQLILLDEMREFEVRRDELMKLMNLPNWQIQALGGLAYKRTKEPALFADAFVPALDRVHNNQVRLEQRIALLRHVEALRLYAAEHDGRLPEKLADVTVPLPPDPFTGKSFNYQVDGTTAHIRGTPPPGEEKTPGFNVHYEVTIQK